MLLRYMKGEYTGESRSADAILEKVSPYIEPEDARHIYRIITQGCPSRLIFDEDTMNKLAVIEKGNQQTFEAHPEVVEKNHEQRRKKQPRSTIQTLGRFLFTFPSLHPTRNAQKEWKVPCHIRFLHSNLDERSCPKSCHHDRVGSKYRLWKIKNKLSDQHLQLASKLPSGNHIRGTRRYRCVLPLSTVML